MGEWFKAVSSTWDPKNYIEDAKMPILWVNSDRDVHFSVNITSKSHERTAANSRMTIYPNLSHDHYITDKIYPGVANFADKVIFGKKCFVDITNAGDIIDGKVKVEYTSPEGCYPVSAMLVSCTDSNPRYLNPNEVSSPSLNEWQETEFLLNNDGEITVNISSDINMFYINIKDNLGNITSTWLYRR